MASPQVTDKQPIDIGADRWAFTITGDPSLAPGVKGAIGSVARQSDSAPADLLWEKYGPLQTDWQSFQSGGTGAAVSSSTGAFRATAYSVPFDGSTDSSAATTTLVGTTMPQTGGPYSLIIGPGETLYFANDFIFPANVRVQSTGGLIKVASGKVVTLMTEPTSTGPLLDPASGGTLAMGGPFVVRPEWFGADKIGTADFSAGREKMTASLLTQDKGGVLYFPSGIYSMDDQGSQFSANYGGVTVRGDGYSTQFVNRTKRTNADGDFRGLFGFYGGGTDALSHLAFKDFRMTGVDTGDCATPIILDQASDITFENVWFDTWGIECVRALSGTQVHRVTIHNCHAKNTGLARTGGVFNIGAGSTTMTDSTFEGCSVALETANLFTTVSNCRFKDMTQWGIMMFSTWSGWLDADNSYVQVNGYGGSITNNQFINIPDRAILIPDYTGHANGDVVHTSPAHIDGNKGQLIIQGNLFDRCGTATWGGADLKGTVDFSQNLISGQWGTIANQTASLCPQAGTWNIHHNTWQVGLGLGYSVLVYGNEVVAGKFDRMSLSDNTVVNNCCNSVMFGLGPEDVISRTRFIDLDGTLAAAGSQSFYRAVDPNGGGVLSELKGSEWAWNVTDHQFSHYREPNRIPVYGNALPATFTFKPGDVLVNYSPSVAWNQKRCITGGSIDPTPLTQTAAGTIATTTLTLSAAITSDRYRYIYFPALPAIAAKRIVGGFGTTTVTLETALEVGVTAGTAIAWAVPTFQTDRDISTLSIASQATGDLPYMASGTAVTRLPVGSVGQYLQVVSGLPAWGNSPAVLANVNIGAAATATWAANAATQKLTTSSASGTVTVAAIPTNEYLFLYCFQGASGSQTITFAQTGMGSVVWANGGTPPTMTATAGQADLYSFWNDGTRVVADVVKQNI